MTPATPSPLALMQAALAKLTTEELQQLRSSIELRLRRSFTYGQVVEFNDRAGSVIQMRIDRINPKTLGGIQVGGTGGRPGMKWRVHPSFCRTVRVASAVSPAPAPAPKLPAFTPHAAVPIAASPDFGTF